MEKKKTESLEKAPSVRAAPYQPSVRSGKRGNAACRWCFTVNNWTEEEYGLIEATCRSSASYLIIGKEVGEEGTPHLQGYVIFKKKLRLATLKKLPGFTRAHAEIAKGSPSQNRQYCQKGKNYLEIGALSRPGTPKPLTETINLLRQSNGDLRKAAEQYPEVFVRHGRGLRDYVTTAGLVPPRALKTQVHVLVGPPGVGKTRHVAESTASQPTYWKPRGPWWDGYCGEPNVVFDDFYGWIPFAELLRVCDRYPLKVPVKGAFVEFTAEHLYITSNKPPEEWYDAENITGTIEALFRRINELLVWDGVRMSPGEPMYQINY